MADQGVVLVHDFLLPVVVAALEERQGQDGTDLGRCSRDNYQQGRAVLLQHCGYRVAWREMEAWGGQEAILAAPL
jgi:hypothetical protein